MLLIGPIARYLLAEHGPGYSAWFLEAGHTVLPERLTMMLVRVEAGHTILSAIIISYQNSNVEQHFFVAFFFCLVCGRFRRKKGTIFCRPANHMRTFEDIPH